MKKHFLTGLVILLPIALTLWIVFFLIGVLTNPFVGFVEGILRYYSILDNPFLFLSGHDVLVFWSRIFILIFFVGLSIFIGFLASQIFLKAIFSFGDYLFHRIPLVNKIYKAVRDITHTIFSQEKTTFTHVVLVPYPHEQTYVLGLLASSEQKSGSSPEYQDKMSVFVPGTPNPTFGFMLLFPKDKVIILDMKVDDAMKFVVSCGMLNVPINVKSG